MEPSTIELLVDASTTLGAAIIAVLGTLAGAKLTRQASAQQLDATERQAALTRETDYLREVQGLAAEVATTMRSFMVAVEEFVKTSGEPAVHADRVSSTQDTFANAATTLAMRLADDKVYSYVESMLKSSVEVGNLCRQYVNYINASEGDQDERGNAANMIKRIRRMAIPLLNASNRFIDTCRARLALPAQRELRDPQDPQVREQP